MCVVVVCVMVCVEDCVFMLFVVSCVCVLFVVGSLVCVDCCMAFGVWCVLC